MRVGLMGCVRWFDGVCTKLLCASLCQLYVKKELVGGCDIILEMQASGELKPAIEEMLV